MHAAFLAALERIVRRDAILRDETELLAYESDGLARLRERPGLVVLPLPNGEMVHVGGSAVDLPGLDLVGVLVGSEGTLGVVTKATLRLLRIPETVRTILAAFESTEAAGNAVSDIIGAGIIPAAVEMMDRLTVEAAEAAVHPN